MTMVRNITSHSQRAVLVESGEISNRLASEASRAAYLMNIFASDPAQTATSSETMPRLVSTAKRFAEEYTRTIERLPNRASQNYKSLIPLDVLEQALDLTSEGNAAQNAELAKRLATAIQNAAKGVGKAEEYGSLAAELDSVARRLAAHSRQMTIATIGV